MGAGGDDGEGEMTMTPANHTVSCLEGTIKVVEVER